MGKIDERPKEVSFLQAIKDFFRGYVDFKGRSTLAGYWWIQLIIGLFYVLVFSAGIALFAYGVIVNEKVDPVALIVALIVPLIIFSIIYLALLLPTIALHVRRLRDAGLRGKTIVVYYVLTVILTIINQMNQESFIAIGLLALLGIANFVITVLPSGTLAQGKGNFFVFSKEEFYENY